MARIKRMTKSYYSRSIEHLGRTFVPYDTVGDDVETTAKKLQESGERVIILSVRNPRLRGKLNLHGKPYPDSKWVFVAI